MADAMLYVTFGLSLLLRALLTIGVVACCWFFWRRHKLPSAPWLAVYVLLPWAFTLWPEELWAAYIERSGGSGGFPFGMTTGAFMMWWGYFQGAFKSLAYACVALLVAADAAHALQGTEEATLGRLWRASSWVREHSMALGVSMVVLMLVPPAALIGLYLFG